MDAHMHINKTNAICASCVCTFLPAPVLLCLHFCTFLPLPHCNCDP